MPRKTHYRHCLIEDTKRYYPNNDLASHVIGYVGSDNQGLGGIELEYDDILTGTPGKIVSAADANGNAIATTYESEYAPVDGQSLVLTIDSQIQYYVEKALDQAVADRNPSGGACAIVMNVNNGEILAMASYPDYNPNDPFTLYTSTQQAKLNQRSAKGAPPPTPIRIYCISNGTINALAGPTSPVLCLKSLPVLPPWKKGD